MWDLPRAGLEPVSPASAGRFSTTAPPGKPEHIMFDTKAVLASGMNDYILNEKINPRFLKFSRHDLV